MIDREKAIKGLEEISDYFFSVYHHSKDREEINKAKDRCDAVEETIALLKEQRNEYENGFNDAMLGKQELMYEGTDVKWHKKGW